MPEGDLIISPGMSCTPHSHAGTAHDRYGSMRWTCRCVITWARRCSGRGPPKDLPRPTDDAAFRGAQHRSRVTAGSSEPIFASGVPLSLVGIIAALPPPRLGQGRLAEDPLRQSA